jgi:surface protein
MNSENKIVEGNCYLLHWLNRIRRTSCARGLQIGFLQSDFVRVVYGPMMRSNKLWRTDGDIKVAADLWCSSRDEAQQRYGHIREWDVSSVTDMSGLFDEKGDFNDDISRWDVSNVTNMRHMFLNAVTFNQPLSRWNVSNVTNMCGMFDNAQTFNQPVGDWNVSHVTDMAGLFENAHSFNQPVGDWDVSKVDDICHMFEEARAFNQDLTKWDLCFGYKTRMFHNAYAMSTNNKPFAVRDE